MIWSSHLWQPVEKETPLQGELPQVLSVPVLVGNDSCQECLPQTSNSSRCPDKEQPSHPFPLLMVPACSMRMKFSLVLGSHKCCQWPISCRVWHSQLLWQQTICVCDCLQPLSIFASVGRNCYMEGSAHRKGTCPRLVSIMLKVLSRIKTTCC